MPSSDRCFRCNTVVPATDLRCPVCSAIKSERLPGREAVAARVVPFRLRWEWRSPGPDDDGGKGPPTAA